MPEPYQSAKGYAVLTFPPATPQDKPHVVVIAVHVSELQVSHTPQFVKCNHPECAWQWSCMLVPQPPAIQKYVMRGHWSQYHIIDPDVMPEMPEELRALTDGANVDSMPT